MALVKDQYVVQDSFLPPAIKGFLEGFQFGRFGLRAGRKMVRAMQAVRLQRKLWMRQFGFPLRNAMLFNLPVKVSIAGIPVRLAPRGATAGDLWANRRTEQHEVTFILSVLEP